MKKFNPLLSLEKELYTNTIPSLNSLIFGAFYESCKKISANVKVTRAIEAFNATFNRMCNGMTFFSENDDVRGRFAGKSSFYLWKNSFEGHEVSGPNSRRGDNSELLYELLGTQYVDNSIDAIVRYQGADYSEIALFALNYWISMFAAIHSSISVLLVREFDFQTNHDHPLMTFDERLGPILEKLNEEI